MKQCEHRECDGSDERDVDNERAIEEPHSDRSASTEARETEISGTPVETAHGLQVRWSVFYYRGAKSGETIVPFR